MFDNYDLFKILGFDFLQELNGNMYRCETFMIHIQPERGYYIYLFYENIPLNYNRYPYALEIDGFEASFLSENYEDFEKYLSIRFKEKLRKHKIKLLI